MEIKNRIKIYDIATLLVSIPTTFILNRGNLPKDQNDLITLLLYASLSVIPAVHYGYIENNTEKVKKFKNGIATIKSKGKLENI